MLRQCELNKQFVGSIDLNVTFKIHRPLTFVHTCSRTCPCAYTFAKQTLWDMIESAPGSLIFHNWKLAWNKYMVLIVFTNKRLIISTTERWQSISKKGQKSIRVIAVNLPPHRFRSLLLFCFGLPLVFSFEQN